MKQTFNLVKETNIDRILKLDRNHHSYILYTECGKKLLVSHGSINGEINNEVDLAALLYDNFDYIIVCYPFSVKKFFINRYNKELNVIFPDFNDTVWTLFRKENNKWVFEVSDNKGMVNSLEDFLD